MAGIHGLHGVAGGVLQFGDQAVNLPGGFAGALRQLTHFIGYHGKAATHLASARGFDRRVECQQVGLVGDALDHVHHTADFVAVLGQLRDGLPRFPYHHRQTLDRLAGFAGDSTATAGQAIGFLSGIGRALHVAGHFLSSGGHLIHCRGHLLGFHSLAVQAYRTLVRQRVGLPSLAGQMLGGVLQAGQAGLQTRLLAEDGHFQACLRAATVGVHLRDQRIGRGLIGQAQQPFDTALLPAQAQQAQRNRQRGGQGEAPGGVQPGTDQEAYLTDQNEGQPILYQRQPAITLRHRRFAPVQTLIKRLGAANLFCGGFDPHRFIPHHLAVLQHRRDVGIDPVEVTVLAPVLDDAHPRQALTQRGPHVLEHRARDVRVAHRVVRCADQLFAAEAADVGEGVVAVGDDTLGVGRGNQTLLGREGPFALSDGLVVTHEFPFREALTGFRPQPQNIERRFTERPARGR